MHSSLFSDLQKPFFILAPMDDVTDTVFRQIIASTAAPDLYFTEFVNVDGLQSVGRQKLLKRLQFTKTELPLIAQIWGKTPENYYKTAKEIADGTFAEELGLPKGASFSGIDINMGCPDKAVMKNGCCAALIDNREVALQIIDATKKGAGSLPVSVKTRLGNKQVDLSWHELLLQQKLNALTIHGRTAREMSKVPAHWDEIAKAVNLRNNYMKRDLPVDKSPGSFHIPRVETLVIGNGDVKSLAEANDKVKQYGVDGVMVGRGIFENIALFSGKELSQEQKYELLKSHIRLYDQTWKGTKRFELLKKFVKAYISGFDGAAEVRQKLMQATSSQELLGMLS
jgi:tRNA-dihydrouridine synthase